jgi:hypothetical protein
MSTNAIKTLGEALATESIAVAQNIPQWLLKEQRVPPWLNLSLALVYLSFAKHWLPFLPASAVAKAVDKCMDDCFFDFVDHTNFDLRVSHVLVHPSEQAFYCEWASITPEQFHREHTNTQTLLNLLFANRCNQYSADLRAGIIYALEKKTNVLGPVIFAYKRLNQHMWAVPCDLRSADLEDDLKHLSLLTSMLMDGLQATQRLFNDGMSTLPFTL